MFKVTGTINGTEESITYTWEQGHGRIEGDPMVMFLMRSALERTTPVGPPGQYMDRSLDEPLAALFMIRECFEKITAWEGELPEAETVPDGAMS